MNLFETLKQFKKIEPRADFSERSKREILLSPQGEPFVRRRIFSFLHVLETGVAVALAGLFILILTGSFSGTNSIAPIQYSVIDPAGLHAEAQAIDMQIQLADINYPQVTSTASGASTVAAAAGVAVAFSKALEENASSSVATSTASAAATSTPSSTLSVDQALEELSH
jgi:hypothetical protein